MDKSNGLITTSTVMHEGSILKSFKFATEAKAEMLGKELEKAGGEMGKVSLDIVISAMGSIDCTGMEPKEDHENEHQ